MTGSRLTDPLRTVDTDRVDDYIALDAASDRQGLPAQSKALSRLAAAANNERPGCEGKERQRRGRCQVLERSAQLWPHYNAATSAQPVSQTRNRSTAWVTRLPPLYEPSIHRWEKGARKKTRRRNALKVSRDRSDFGPLVIAFA